MWITPASIREIRWYLRPFFWRQKRKYGQVLQPALIWARVPRLFLAVGALFLSLDRRSSPLDPTLRSLVTVRVSQLNWCNFCVDINSATLARRAGNLDKVTALGHYRDSSIFSAAERLALDYAQAITDSNRHVDEAMKRQLREHFTEDQIVELTALIAFQNMSSKFNSALDLPPQGFCQLPTNPEKYPPDKP